MEFGGFSRAGLRFLTTLGANDKAWFDANRAVCAREVVAPSPSRPNSANRSRPPLRARLFISGRQPSALVARGPRASAARRRS
jgi:hypothetical protein